MKSAGTLGMAFMFLMPTARAGEGATQNFQKEVIAACLVMEAGVEGTMGMQGVMDVIVNRASGKPGGFYGVVTRSKQFSSLNGISAGVPENYVPFVDYAKNSKRWTDAEMIVERAFAKNLPDVTGGATHYYSLGMKEPPDWAQFLQETVKIKHHRFMKEPGV